MAEKGNYAVRPFANTVPEAPQGPFKLPAHFQSSPKLYKRGSASMQRKRTLDDPASLPQSRLSRYHAGTVKLSRAVQQQTRIDAEIDVRTSLALAALKTERFDEHNAQEYIAGLENHTESIARCNQLAQAKANSVRESYLELKGALKRLESGEAAAIALTQKNERLLNSLEQVEASFLACWPKLQAESRKSLRAELDRLRMENKGLHGEQNLTVKLFMTACRRDGTVTSALVGGKINAAGPPVDFTEVMKSLNFLMVDARTERHELTGDLQAAQLKIRKLEFALYDLRQQQKRSEEKAAETEQRLGELQTESTRLTHEQNFLITARDNL
jgi:hypothetical protein